MNTLNGKQQAKQHGRPAAMDLATHFSNCLANNPAKENLQYTYLIADAVNTTDTRTALDMVSK